MRPHRRILTLTLLGMSLLLWGFVIACFAGIYKVDEDEWVAVLVMVLMALALLAVALLYAVFRLEYRDGRFLAYPDKKEFGLEELTLWEARVDSDTGARHLELRFDRWYRRYLLLEEDLVPGEYDALLVRLEARQSALGEPGSRGAGVRENLDDLYF